ncbi:type IV pilin [Vibrio sp. RE86]|uniref:type IV pilus modification PilV family protein n=1 Tax=Vibrio sp. RE86 TaxID=2607605 RepID=UPI001493CE9C|nr:prepilin-type N-terminal cleavage/methylation domain-containing protein [Vibrio sp. RE86]NOH79004.1 type IV pilin [Vibrio sp. RE86]
MCSSKQSGFSFIEVLIAFLLIGVASLGLVKMQSFVEQRADFAVKSNQAMNIAEQKLEWFRTRGASSAMSSMAVSEFSTIVDGQDLTSHAPYSLTWQVASPSSTLSSSLKSISVNVEWPDRLGESQSLTLETMLSSHSEFDM